MLRLETERGTDFSYGWQASRDALTGLPNRMLLMDRLAQAILRVDRFPNRRIVVLVIDLDGFGRVNADLGLSGADEVLRATARRLQAHLRESDTVGRLRDDEFLILLDDVRTTNDIDVALERIRSALDQPLETGGEGMKVSASIGGAMYPFDDFPSNSPDPAYVLCNRAYIAMNQVKTQGGGSHRMFDEEFNYIVQERHSRRHRVVKSLESKTLTLRYQPVMDLRTGALVSAEALLRFPGADGGLELPGPCLAAVEATRHMWELDQWVLERGLAQVEHWAEQGDPKRVSINLSSDYFRQIDCVQILMGLLRKHPLSRSLVQLEITDPKVPDELQTHYSVLGRISELGVELVLDDFGNGPSSLAMLQNVPFSEVKVHREIIHGLRDRAGNAAMVEALLAFARAGGQRIIAKGVESSEQRQLLNAMGCRYVQGFAVAKALPADVLSKWQHATSLPGRLAPSRPLGDAL